jgi:hypothetical protein
VHFSRRSRHAATVVDRDESAQLAKIQIRGHGDYMHASDD